MGFLHRVEDDIRALKDLLKRYAFGHDGRAVYRELLQNADDAGATLLQLHLFEQGFSPTEVQNSLLTGPALVTINNGSFRKIDARNMRYATGTSKSREVGAVGRFGLGQKSVFHFCESWLCVGSSASEGVTACMMNPWSHSEDGDRDFPDWDSFPKSDQAALQQLMKPYLRGEDWFILWVPLRQRTHRRKRSGVISEWYPDISTLNESLAELSALGSLLPQMGRLQRIEVHHHRAPGEFLGSRYIEFAPRSRSLSRPTSTDYVDRAFSGTIQEDEGVVFSYTGVERVDMREQLFRLQEDERWPRTVVESDDGPVEEKELILPHGAATVVLQKHTGLAKLTVDWCVFLPMAAQSWSLALPDSSHNITIRLHGYFFPDHGRRQITGFSKDTAEEADGTPSQFEALWNRNLRDGVVLPCLLPALEKTLRLLPAAEQIAVVTALRDSPLFTEHRDIICAKYSLVRNLSPKRPFSLISSSAHLLPVPAPVLDKARASLLPLLKRAVNEGEDELVLQGGSSLTPRDMRTGWSRVHLTQALASPPSVST